MKLELSLILLILLLISCSEPIKIKTRQEAIPADAIKMTPEMDKFPPILHSDEFEQPVPLAIISTAGAEDSPFIPENRNELYFVFVKDVREDVHIQVRDPVNGIWMSKMEDGAWQEPTLVRLQDPAKLALNGCEYVHKNNMLFCTAREGYTGMHWFSAEYKNGDFKEEFEVGELHIWKDELYYGSYVKGGKGDQDIWMLRREENSWVDPINIEAVNSEYNDGYPFITSDGKEMWINRFYKGSPSVWRSIRTDEGWQEPELIVSQFAGEPTLDKVGNLYFVHHYYDNSTMIEADIYIAYKK